MDNTRPSKIDKNVGSQAFLWFLYYREGVVKVEDKCAIAVTIRGPEMWLAIACHPEEPGERGMNETLMRRGEGRGRGKGGGEGGKGGDMEGNTCTP